MREDSATVAKAADLPGLGNEIDGLGKVVAAVRECLGCADTAEARPTAEPLHPGSKVGQDLEARILAIGRLRNDLEDVLPALSAIVKMVNS